MRYLHFAGIFAAGILLQWLWPTYGSIYGLTPQVLLVLTVAVAAQAGPVVSQSLAFFWGIFLDILGAHLFGCNALTLTLIAYAVGMARRQMDVSSPLSQAMVTGFVTVAYFLFLSLLGWMFKGDSFWVGWKAFCLDPLLDAAAAPIGFSIVRRYVEP